MHAPGCRSDRFPSLPTLLAALLFAFAPAQAIPTPAHAAGNADARLAIHLLSPTTKNACGRTTATPACAAIVTNGALYPALYYGYLLVTNADAAAGLAGVQCGISYDGIAHSGVDIFTWNLCATLEFRSGQWPAAGGGNLITWDSTTRCQRTEPGGAGMGVVAPAGYFYLAAYTPDVLQLTTRPVDGVAKVADCANAESVLEGGAVHHVPSVLGSASFSAGGGAAGYNPCDPNPVAIDCTISGPAAVLAGSTGNVYSAPLAPPGAGYQWSVSGNGSIQGAATNPTVAVTAGGAGGYTVAVTVTSGSGSGLCSKSVTVNAAPPACSISGTSPVSARTQNLAFDVTVPASIVSVTWSITGDGTITGGLHSTRVAVTSGEPGAFDLTATVQTTASNLPSVCTRTFTVVEPPVTCLISGPGPVLAGQGGLVYQVLPGGGDLVSVAWTISGNGTITTPTDGATVTVQAGAIGAFDLGVTIHTNHSSLEGSCQRTISVNAPVPVSCDILGAATAPAQTAGLSYTVEASGPITNVDWSVTGDATIPANSHGATITVNTGAAGAFELSALVSTTTDFTPGHCARTVTVVDAPPACTVTGPAAAYTGATASYDVSLDTGTVTSVAWTITGNGTITSDPHARPVTVHADAAGGFELTATTVTSLSALPAVCARTVTVTDPPAPSCSITGPTTASEGTLDLVYTLVPVGNYDSVSWSITGDGTITSSLTATVVHVQAGGVGAFTLTATLHGPGAQTHSCAVTVTLTPFVCAISGPDPVLAGATGLIYSAGAAVAGATYQWQLAGNGSIVGGTQGASLMVNATSVGAFTVSVTITRNGTSRNCSRTVTVNTGGVHGQAGAKLLIHLATVTAKNECGARGAPACNGVVTNGSLFPTRYFAYLVVTDGTAANGVAGLQCGIDYDAAAHSGLDIFGWTLCATLEFASAGPHGPWPAAGSGNLVTWDATRCQRTEPGGPGNGVVATAGYFYCAAYSDDRLQVIPRPVDSQAKVADCGGQESLIGGAGFPANTASHLGFAQFTLSGAAPGYNPCGGVLLPVRPTTWSAIKGMYREPAVAPDRRKPYARPGDCPPAHENCHPESRRAHL